MENELIENAISELLNPTFGTTKQYLEVFDVEKVNGRPKVERVDVNSFDDLSVVYFAVKEEPFFFSFYFSKETHEIVSVGTENSNQVYLTTTSEKFTFDQLAGLTSLTGLTGWSINDMRPNGKSRYNFTRLSFEPIKNRAFDLETKLKLLLTDLEKDVVGVKSLVESGETYISIHLQQYIDGNKGVHLSRATIERISELHLALDFDQYVFGKELK